MAYLGDYNKPLNDSDYDKNSDDVSLGFLGGIFISFGVVIIIAVVVSML